MNYLRHLLASALTIGSLAGSLSASAIENTPSGTFQLSADNLQTIKFRFRVDSDPGDGSYVFWAQQFWINGGSGGYLGMQRDASSVPYKKKVIFSIWDTLKSKAGNMPNAKAEPFGGEGIGQHVIAALDWKIGHTYAFTLRDGADHWWNVGIVDEATGQSWDLGSIQAPASWQRLQSHVTTFTEVYVNGTNCEQVPYARASFLPPIGNDGKALDFAPLRHPYTYGTGACAAASKFGARPGDNVGTRSDLSTDGALVHQIGLSNGPQKWGDYDRKAQVGLLFAYPHNGITEYYRLKQLGSDGRYWYFPTDRTDNVFWDYAGTAYDGNTFIKYWGDNDRKAKLGDVFVYANPYSKRTEYFKLKALGADGRYWYFPTNGGNNAYWTFAGTIRPS